MKSKLFLITALLFSSRVALSQTWNNPFFEMQISANWRKPDRDYSSYPPLKYNDGQVLLYKDVRFTPEEDEKNGTILVETFIDKDSQKLFYKDFITKSFKTLSKKHFKVNNMACLKESVITKVFSQKGTLYYYCTKWYIQGSKRVYRIEFGAYDLETYKNHIDEVENFITTFKEK